MREEGGGEGRRENSWVGLGFSGEVEFGGRFGGIRGGKGEGGERGMRQTFCTPLFSCCWDSRRWRAVMDAWRSLGIGISAGRFGIGDEGRVGWGGVSGRGNGEEGGR